MRSYAARYYRPFEVDVIGEMLGIAYSLNQAGEHLINAGIEMFGYPLSVIVQDRKDSHGKMILTNMGLHQKERQTS